MKKYHILKYQIDINMDNLKLLFVYLSYIIFLHMNIHHQNHLFNDDNHIIISYFYAIFNNYNLQHK